MMVHILMTLIMLPYGVEHRLETVALSGQLPRDRLHDFIAEANLNRPVPTTARR
jgi:hypothetical protein